MKQVDYLQSNNNDMVLDIAFQLLYSKELPVIICVGQKNTTDTFTTTVAELLIKKFAIKAYVYGRKDNPINCKNLKSAVSFINSKHKNSKVFVIYSKVDKKENNSILYYGSGKSLLHDCIFGDYAITTTFNNYPLLLGTEKLRQFKVAQFIAKSLELGVSYSTAIKNFVTQKNSYA